MYVTNLICIVLLSVRSWYSLVKNSCFAFVDLLPNIVSLLNVFIYLCKHLLLMKHFSFVF